MSKTFFNKQLDYILSNILRPIFKRYGYRKKRRNFVKDTPETWILINFQNDRYNTAENGQFTINTGIYFKRFNDSQHTNCPPIHQMHLRSRINSFLNKKGDIWFQIDRNTDILNLSLDLILYIQKYMLPTLEELKTEDGALKWFEQDISRINIFWESWMKILDVCIAKRKMDLAISILEYKLSSPISNTLKIYLQNKLKEFYSLSINDPILPYNHNSSNNF